MYLNIWIILILFAFIVDQVVPSSEKKLIKQLIDNYEHVGKIGRPVKNTKDRVVVGYGLSLFQLLDLDEKNQILTINVWAKYTWIDQLLRWNPANYSNIREVRIPPSLIWTPDIVLYNYADERLKEKRDVMLNVDYMGRVFWSPPAIFKSNCPIDIKNFPFDYQHCFLKFASWTYDSEQLDLQFLDNVTEVDVDQYTSSNEWTIVARPAYRFIMLSEECGKEIPDLTFFLFLKRNPAFYGYILVFPCVLLSVITTVIFWLPPQIPAKMILSMNIFVAFSLLLKILAVSTPSASTIVPFLGYFYCLNMTLLSLSTFVSTVLVNMHFQRVKTKHVPMWLVRVVRFFATPLHISKLQPSKEVQQKVSEIEAKIKQDKLMQQLNASPSLVNALNLINSTRTNTMTTLSTTNKMDSDILDILSDVQMLSSARDPFWGIRNVPDSERTGFTNYHDKQLHLVQLQQRHSHQHQQQGKQLVVPTHSQHSLNQPITAQNIKCPLHSVCAHSSMNDLHMSQPTLSENFHQTGTISALTTTPLNIHTNQDKHVNNTDNLNQNLNVEKSAGSVERLARRRRMSSRRQSTVQLQFNLSDLCNALKSLMIKISKKDEVNQRAGEWRLVLLTIDRLFCWFYLIVVIVAGIYLLHPRGRAHTVDAIVAMHQDEYDIRNRMVATQCRAKSLKTY